MPPARTPIIKSKRDLLILNLFFVLVVIGVVSYFILNLLPQPQPIIQPQLESVEEIENITSVVYTGDMSVPVSSLPVQSVTNYRDSTYFLNRLRQKFNLSASPYAKTVFINEDRGISLVVEKNSQYMFFSDSSQLGENFEALPSEAEYLQKAVDFLTSLGFESDQLVLQSDLTQLQTAAGSGLEMYPTTDASKAYFVTLYFSQRANDIPVFFANEYSYQVILTLSKNGVYSMSLIPFSVEFRTGEEKDIISVDEAINNIRKGQYVATSALSRVGEEVTVESITLSKKRLVYRFIPEQQLLLPYYDFSGEALLSNESVSDIQLTTPAIRIE